MSLTAWTTTSSTVPAAMQNTVASFSLPPLAYSVHALEPAIDARTMTVHHGKHLQGYIDSLNRAVAADPTLAGMSLDQLVMRAGDLRAVVRNNAGGHFFLRNHGALAKWGTVTRACRCI